MSQEDVELIRQFFEGLTGEGRQDAVERLTHEDVVYVEDPRRHRPGGDPYRGREAVARCWEDYHAMLGDEMAVSFEGIREASDEIVAILHVSGRARASHAPFDHTWGFVCRVRDGRVSYFRAYVDPSDAFKAAGLRE